MTCKMYGAFIASLGLVTLLVATNATLARSGAVPHAGVSTHPISHPPVAYAPRHHRRYVGGVFLPADGGFYGPSNGEPAVDVPPPASGDVHYTYTQDVPWDWAHRYPPSVTPSDRPYVSSCPTEIVTLTGRPGGKEQTVNITRCY
jgi:hypothetical protein